MGADRTPEQGRDPEAATGIVRRLARIEGQVRALKARVEQDAYCVEVAGEVAAIRSALGAVGAEVVARHARTCLAGRGTEAAHPASREKPDEDLAAELGGIVARMLR